MKITHSYLGVSKRADKWIFTVVQSNEMIEVQTKHRPASLTLWTKILECHSTAQLGDNCIQNFHLGRYNIVGYTVGYLVFR